MSVRSALEFCRITTVKNEVFSVKEALYRIWCGANRLGDGVYTLGDKSAFVNPAGQLLLPGGVRPEWILSA